MIGASTIEVYDHGRFQIRVKPGDPIKLMSAELQFSAMRNEFRTVIIRPGEVQFNIVALSEGQL